MKTQCEAIIEAFKSLEGERTIKEIEDWVIRQHGTKWKNFGTAMADMVPLSKNGNPTSEVQSDYQVLQRVSRGKYRLTL
jgi:hypothetical protein